MSKVTGLCRLERNTGEAPEMLRAGQTKALGQGLRDQSQLGRELTIRPVTSIPEPSPGKSLHWGVLGPCTASAVGRVTGIAAC